MEGGVIEAAGAVLATALALPAQGSVTSICSLIGLPILLLVSVLVLKRSMHLLGKSEQLVVESFTETTVLNGPGVKFLNPVGYKSTRKVLAEMLSTMEYLRLKDSVNGQERVERGPQLLFLGPYEAVTGRGLGVTLSSTEYLTVQNELTGDSSMVKGPCVWFPSTVFERASGKQCAIMLQEDDFVCLKDQATGQRWVQKGKALVFLEPTWKSEGGTKKAWTLKSFEYVRLLDSVTGKVTVHRGEQMVFPGPNENLLDDGKLSAIDLKVDEYVRLEDKTDGKIRVVAGTSRVFLGPSERVLDGGKQKAVQVDEESAVLVRDMSTGQQRLVTEKQLFVPGPDESIQEVRELIRLSDHEALITKDGDGKFDFHYGKREKNLDGGPTAFFLPPYHEKVELWWSSGLRRERRDLCIKVFDCRSQYMWFEFDCRTSDNVELILEVTMFWEVVDLPKLVRATGNLPGDIYNQARSQFIRHVARVTLKAFMDELHSVSRTVHEEDSSFYESRGVKIHSLEVTRYTCSEQRTSEVLQQIIEETTNRLNRLSQVESENEVKIFRMQGQIEQEKLNAELLEIQHRHAEQEAQVSGAAEANRVAAFMQGLAETVPTHEDRLTVWQTLRKNDALSVVSAGGGNLYYTPNDVDLSIRTEGHTRKEAI